MNKEPEIEKTKTTEKETVINSNSVDIESYKFTKRYVAFRIAAVDDAFTYE